MNTLADRVGDWTRRHPAAVVSGATTLGGGLVGLMLGGLTGALSGAATALFATLFISVLEPRDPELGPHH